MSSVKSVESLLAKTTSDSLNSICISTPAVRTLLTTHARALAFFETATIC